MAENPQPRERLAAILMADAVGYSRLMRADEHATVETLDAYRAVFRQRVEAHGGRIVDMAGDSILAVFETAIGAVRAADEVQKELFRRNVSLSDERKMQFRIGVNLGDILEKADGTVYGDGLNVAARLEALADAGGVNVSGSIYDSVRAKFSNSFVYLGKQELKNISAPVAVYKMGEPDDLTDVLLKEARKQGYPDVRPTVVVRPLKVISGDESVHAIAEGFRLDIVNGLTKQTAIDVISATAIADTNVKSHNDPAFTVDGSVQAAGERLRFTFSLTDCDGRHRIWSERYDRKLDDIFDLENEVSFNVVSAVRIQIKARAFEKLRNTDNNELQVPELLSKAAGYFVDGYGHNAEAAQTLQAALTRIPDNSMANAMMILCRYRMLEFSAFDTSSDVKDELLNNAKRALSLDPSSYFAHFVMALVTQDLFGDYTTALIHAETALELNRGFSPAIAMAGIAKIHLGDPQSGLRELRSGIAVYLEDPHRLRHQRELAIGHFVAGDSQLAAARIDKLVRLAPELRRNELPAAALLMHAGRESEARQTVKLLLDRDPTLTQRNMRPIWFGASDMTALYVDSLSLAGLPRI
jgi:adenylate cyclase